MISDQRPGEGPTLYWRCGQLLSYEQYGLPR